MKKTSQSTVRRVVQYWLERPPEIIGDYCSVKYIICDGSLLNRRTGIYAIMNSENHQIINAAYGVREGAKDLQRYYQQLKSAGLEPLSATVDGKTQQIKYLREFWPSIIIQRCIVHIQRQGLSWCRRNPKRTDAKHLRELLLVLPYVKTIDDSLRFIKGVQAWEDRFGTGIESSPNRGRVFTDLVRARSMLLKALPNMFHYLTDPNISRTTNAVEGYFSRVKEHYRLHRGLSKKNRKAYFQWYFFLKPR